MMKQYADQFIRISSRQTEQIIQQLWHSDLFPEGVIPHVYAILDGARNRKIQPMLRSLWPRHYCLFEGELDYSLTVAAPYMMRLEEDADFTRELIQQAWGNSWGIFAIGGPKVSLIRVRSQCRENMHVSNEAGDEMLFRFYDPRVMRKIILNFHTDELKQVFGEITAYALEDNNATGLVFYSPGASEGELQTEVFPVTLIDTKEIINTDEPA